MFDKRGAEAFEVEWDMVRGVLVDAVVDRPRKIVVDWTAMREVAGLRNDILVVDGAGGGKFDSIRCLSIELVISTLNFDATARISFRVKLASTQPLKLATLGRGIQIKLQYIEEW